MPPDDRGVRSITRLPGSATLNRQMPGDAVEGPALEIAQGKRTDVPTAP